MANNVLLTGQPGVGKTTLLKTLVKRLGHLALTGFYTEEIREGSSRVGFKAVALNGSSAIFAHRHFHTPPRLRVGKYGVKPEVLDQLILPHLDARRKGAALVVVDEIARMELLSEGFRERLLDLLDADCPLLGTIALKGTGLIKRIKEREDVQIFEVTRQNRNVLGEQVYRELREILRTSQAPQASQA